MLLQNQTGKRWETLFIALLEFLGLWEWIPSLGKKLFGFMTKQREFHAAGEMTFQIVLGEELFSKGNLRPIFHLYLFLTFIHA